MTYVITEPCIGTKDQSCVEVCPVDCIYDAGDQFLINPEECIDCGACEPECPVEAIFPEDALPEKWEPFVRINYAFPEGMDVVNHLAGSTAATSDVRPPGAIRRSSGIQRSTARVPRAAAAHTAAASGQRASGS